MPDVDPFFWMYLLMLAGYFGIALRRTLEDWKNLKGWKSIGIWASLLLFQVGFIGGFAYLFVTLSL